MDKRTLLFVFCATLSFMVIRNYFEPPKQNKQIETVTPKEEKKTSTKEAPSFETKATNDEKPSFYVLENDFQQIVFSSVGGSIVEINLPFKSEGNEKSVVRSIRLDKELEQQKEKLALFPLHQALEKDGSMRKQAVGGYYPLLRRETKFDKGAAHFFCCNIVSSYAEVAKLHYDLVSMTDKEIVFTATQPHRKITKTFTLPESADATPYCFKLDVQIEGDQHGLYLTSGIPEIEWISGNSGSFIKYHIFKNQSSKVEKVDLPKDYFALSSLYPDWVCNGNGFFGLIVDPLKGNEQGFRIERVPGAKYLSRLFFIDRNDDRFPANKLDGFQTLVPLSSEEGDVKHFRFFAGPLSTPILKHVDSFFKEEQGGRVSNYQKSQTFHGWFSFISEPFSRFLLFLMRLFHSLFDSWALSIVLTTIALRLLLFPLNAWSMGSMKRMQLISPKVQALQERYKKDPKKAQMAVMELYREHKVNPLSGCLPLLIQMPFLIGMFDLLKSAFELRGAPFIHGWIDDLSAPDVLFTLPFSIPYIGNQLHILPILLGLSMFLQQTLMSSLKQKASDMTDQQRQQKAMGNMMTLVMTVMFYHFPAGLNIYWISSTLLGIIQQWWTNRSVTIPQKNEPKSPKKK